MAFENNKSDEELWMEFVTERNREQLAVLFDRYLMMVYGVCLKYLTGREDARDAAMEIFEKLFTTHTSQKVDNFRTWLYVVTKNHCLMKLRSQKNASEKAREIFMEFQPELHPLDEEEEDRSPALHYCLNTLKTEQKACVALFYFEKKTYAEISGETGFSLNEVKSFIQNGKRNIKICMEKRNE